MKDASVLINEKKYLKKKQTMCTALGVKNAYNVPLLSFNDVKN